LNIVVCIKQVPDSAAKVVAEGGKAYWGEAPLVMNPWDEYAVETALLQQEQHGGQVIVISVGGPSATEALKSAMAMGCNQAYLISDQVLANADSQAISRVLAGAIQKIGNVDLAVFGKQAIDSDMGVTAPQTARVLGWPVISLVSAVRETNPGIGKIVVERSVENGRQIVEGALPVVITVSKDIAEPRYPSFMGIRKAAKAEIPVWTLEDLDMEVPAPVVHWPEVENPPSREITNEMISGENPQEIADMLVDKILDEKVL
jgi:electron transfer flavoprotein beta subunit